YKDITLQPGKDETEMNFCWYSNAGNTTCSVQFAKKSDMKGFVFPESAVRYVGVTAVSTGGFYSNKVTVRELKAATEYAYRISDGTSYSPVFFFKTGNSESYNAIFLSDPQIGASGSIADDSLSWKNTLKKVLSKLGNCSFILSAGDQVDYSKSETEYDSFFAPAELKSIPLAPAVGNHDNGAINTLFTYHYDLPNTSAQGTYDYWFRYGNTLYMVLNTNNTNVSVHDVFMGEAIAANPGVKWTILMFHQSIYSSAAHSTEASIVSLRKSLYPVIDKYHIDIVLSGHDHCYTRTYQMMGGTAQKTQTTDSKGGIVNPTGTLYITAGSATGSKYYKIKTAPEAYSAVRMQLNVPTFSNIQVSKDTLTVTTYRVDTMAAVDSYKINKSNNWKYFSDVLNSEWYSTAVNFIASKNIATGAGSKRYYPDATLTRGQFIALLMKAYSIKPDATSSDNFTDAGNTYYTGYLSAAKQMGITQGVGKNQYNPNGQISRQDMVVILYRCLKTLGKLPVSAVHVSLSDFADSNIIAAYAKNAFLRFVSCGAITGSNHKLNPEGVTTRSQMAQIFYNLLPK
ncbi:MAG: S-layer homology domain-containing protein, partial [Clostridiales bacterium]|nr:S-layer homology domain-containing protein [Clostridiales bacterium]